MQLMQLSSTQPTMTIQLADSLSSTGFVIIIGFEEQP
jgi:hypothetical protein